MVPDCESNSTSSSSSATVHFSQTLITSIHHRPYTETIDIPNLYYKKRDVKQFKREYRQLIREHYQMRVERMAHERMEELKGRKKIMQRTYGRVEGKEENNATCQASKVVVVVEQMETGKLEPPVFCAHFLSTKYLSLTHTTGNGSTELTQRPRYSP